MVFPKFSLNEGSLLRRTLLHVATFVAGSMAFVGLVSFVLLAVVRGLVPHAGGSDATAEVDDGAASGKASAIAGTAGAKPGINKKKVLPTTAERSKNE